jgi:hypothetical protein
MNFATAGAEILAVRGSVVVPLSELISFPSLAHVLKVQAAGADGLAPGSAWAM